MAKIEHPAAAYVRNKWALVAIPRGQKGPRTPGWNKNENAITTATRAAKLNGHNLGLLHEFSGTCTLDVDDLKAARAYLKGQGIDLDALLKAPGAVQIKSGRPNRAKLLYRLPKGVKTLPTHKLADGALELRCAGVQDVLPPSIHPDTGKPYKWAGDWRKLPRLSKPLHTLWNAAGKTARAGKPAVDGTGDEIVFTLKARGQYVNDAGNGKHLITCPWQHEHTADGGAGESAYFMPHTNGYASGAFKCFHAHCAQRTLQDLRVHLGLEQSVQPGDEGLMQRRFTVGELLAEAVYLSGRDTVTLASQPWIDCSAEHFKRLTAASTETIQTPNGPRVRSVADLWLAHPQRKTVDERTFNPGADVLCADPNGRMAVNTWRAVTHTPPKNWNQRAQPFIEHLRYLIPDAKDREQCMLWVAHLIQRPGDMPPWHVLMYTEGAQGVGRNWLAALIGAMVRPYAALHVDIEALAGNAHGVGFNGALAGKLFACVDELHASAFATGGRRMMEALKSGLTAETRLVNPKYGRQTVEFNRLRVLILSNHRDAMPLNGEDRRFLVIRNPDEPKTADYYTQLYGLLRDPEFIAACWKYLSTRDLSELVMGRAPMTAAKNDLIEAAEPEYITAVRAALEQSAQELITTTAIKSLMENKSLMKKSNVQSWQLQQAMRAVGAVKYPKRVSLGKTGREYVWVLRNHDVWMHASVAAMGKHLVAELASMVNLATNS